MVTYEENDSADSGSNRGSGRAVLLCFVPYGIKEPL